VADKFLPFALPDIGEDEINEVVDSLRSGWITTGPKTKRFEADFAAFLGGDVHTAAVNSATAGLHLAVEAVGVGAGDEVITTPHTFTATAEVIRYMGANPVFVDIDPNTFCIDPKKIEAAITPKTKAIMPVHFAGMAADMPAILQIARKHNLKVVEDAAHALPTTSSGKLIGTLESDVTVFSFYPTKTITTGEGGMVVTRDEALAKRIRVMRLHGMDHDTFNRYTSTKPAWSYDIIAPGYKYNMTDIASSIGIHQLKRIHDFHIRRSAMAARYDAELKGLPLLLPPRPQNGDTHSWHLYVIRVSDMAKVKRNDFIIKMSELGIGCGVHYIPLHLFSYWRDTYKLKPDQFPHADKVYEGAVSLPLYTKMTDDDQTRVIAAIKSILQ
jgi:dTDP-4-amino-4,6-dideoxygalactose transaminase